MKPNEDWFQWWVIFVVFMMLLAIREGRKPKL